MKVLVVAANREISDPVFPLGASYIAHSLEISGHEIEVFDIIEDNPFTALEAKLNFQPQVIAFQFVM